MNATSKDWIFYYNYYFKLFVSFVVHWILKLLPKLRMPRYKINIAALDMRSFACVWAQDYY